MTEITPEQLAAAGSESAHQKALFCWASIMARHQPELSLLFAIPNGGVRNKITAARMKVEGVKRGVPDIMLPVARAKYHGLFLELKVGTNKPSKEQYAWLSTLREQGYFATVCWNWQDAAGEIQDYLAL